MTNINNKIINEIVKNIKQQVIAESSINRIKQWIDSHDIAILTAFRDEFKNATNHTLDDRPNEIKMHDKDITNSSEKTSYTYTTTEKKKRNSDLYASLLYLKYGVTKISGNYIENYKEPNAKEVHEESLFVVNLHDDPNFYKNIFELSEYYNQDSFLYKAKDSDDAYLIGTNNAAWLGYNNKRLSGKFYRNIDSEFLSRYKNKSFVFTDDDNPKQNSKTYNFNTRKADRSNSTENVEYPIVMDTWESLSYMGKLPVATEYKRYRKSLDEMKRNDVTNKIFEDEEPSIKKQRGGRRANTTAFMQKNRGISANKSMRGNVNTDGTKKISLNVGASDGGVTLKTFDNYYKLSPNKIQKSDSVNGTSIIKIIDYWDNDKTIKKLVALFVKGVGSKYILRTVVEFNEKGIRSITYKYNTHGYLIEKITYGNDGNTIIKSENIPLPKDALADYAVSKSIDTTFIKENALDYFRTSIYNSEYKNNTNFIRSIDEVGINRLLKHMNDAGVIIISACREQDDDGNQVTSSENKQYSHQLEKDIRQSGFTYSPVYGGYTYKTDDNKSERIFEISFIVYNYIQGNDGYKIGNFDTLKKHAIQWCAKYKQQSVYIQPAGQEPAYYDKNGNKITNLTSANNVDNLNIPIPFINRVLSDKYNAFTTLKKKKRGDTQRFMYDLKWECNLFVNPKTSSLRENMIRRKQNNEFIFE